MKRRYSKYIAAAVAVASAWAASASAQTLTYHIPLNETAGDITVDGSNPWPLSAAVVLQNYQPTGVLTPSFGSASPGGSVNGSTGSVGVNEFGRFQLGPVAPETNPFTIAFSFKMNANAPTSEQRHIISTNSGQAGRWNLIIQNVTGGSVARFFHNSANNWGTTGSGSATSISANAVDITTAFEQDRWYHFAMTRDDDNLFRLFLDGEEVWSASNAGSFTNSSNGVWLGRKTDFGTTGFAGLFDDIRFYDGALSGEQIQSLAIPEPSAYAAIVSLLALGVAGFVRRRNRS